MLYCIDSQSFVWAIKKQADESDKYRLKEAENFINWIDDSKHQLIVPVVVLAECLIREPIENHSKIMEEAYKRFIVADFDARCALKYGEFLRQDKWVEAKDRAKENGIRREKMKLDHMIVVCAIVNGAKAIFSDDKDVRIFSNGIIAVHSMGDIPTQTTILDLI